MNKKIPSLLKLLYIFLILFTFFFGGGLQSFIDGWNSVDSNKPSAGVYHSKIEKTNTSPITLKSGSDSTIINESYREILVHGNAKKQLAGYDIIISTVVFLIVIISVIVFIILYKFTAAISQKEIFIVKNINRLNLIGILSIIISLLFIVYDYMNHLAVKKALQNYSYKVSVEMDFYFWPALFGITLITIAYAFKKGLELQQENELTV